jgi:hypothetical protein
MKNLCTVLYSHFFSSIWWMQKIWSVDLLTSKPTLMIHNNLGCLWFHPWEEDNWIQFWSRLMTVIFLIATVSFIAILVNWYDNRLIPLISSSSLLQIKLTSSWISDRNVSLPTWGSCAGILSLPDDLYFFNFVIAISTSKGLGSGTKGLAVCVYNHYIHPNPQYNLFPV